MTVNHVVLYLARIVTLTIHQVLSLCIVNLVDGLVWNEEAVGSNPAMETKFSKDSNSVRCTNVRLIPQNPSMDMGVAVNHCLNWIVTNMRSQRASD